MGLRDLGELIGIIAVLALHVGGLQLLEWGLAADRAEPAEVDSFEVPNSVDARVQGGGVRAARARALAAELRLRTDPPDELAPEPAR